LPNAPHVIKLLVDLAPLQQRHLHLQQLWFPVSVIAPRLSFMNWRSSKSKSSSVSIHQFISREDIRRYFIERHSCLYNPHTRHTDGFYVICESLLSWYVYTFVVKRRMGIDSVTGNNATCVLSLCWQKRKQLSTQLGFVKLYIIRSLHCLGGI